MAGGFGGSLEREGAAALEPMTPSAFAVRFQDAWPTLWSIAAAVLSDRTGADDVLQEAAMIALGKLEQFDPQTNFTAWMGKIVRFVALNHGRRRLNAVASSADPHSLEIAIDDGADQRPALLSGQGELIGGHDDFDDRVLAALHSLEETARACLLLRTLMNMPYREISVALDIAEGTAMSHVHRARAAMRQRLSSGMPAPPSSPHAHD